MRQVLNLRDENYNWKTYEYTDITELKDVLQSNGINIGDDANIGNDASIGNRANIGNDASIGNRARIGNDASIGYGARIGDDARIGDYASIGYGAIIGNGASILTGLYLFGTRHSITFTGGDTVSIGCHNYPIKRWLESFETIGKKEGYTDEQIKEYKSYLDVMAMFVINNKNKVT